jgi:hypothetical protein
VGLVGVFDAVALQCSQVVPVAQFGHQLFQDRPVALPGRGPVLALQVSLNVVLNTVVFEQGIIHIDQEDDPVSWHHDASPFRR